MNTILIFIEILYRSMSHELKNKSLLIDSIITSIGNQKLAY